VILLYAGLTVGMTYPLVLNLRTAIPGPPWDNFVWLYDLAWFRHSIVELGQWPVFNPTIFVPTGYDLRLSETMLANKALIAPVLFWGDEILAYNVFVLLSFVLTGYTTYLFVAYLTDNLYAATVAGAIFSFCPYRMHSMAAGWLPLLATYWIPLVFLFLERTIREKKVIYGLLMGLFLGLTVLSSWYYLYVVGSMLAIYALLRLRPWGDAFRDEKLARCLVWGGLVTILLVAPVALPVMLNRSGEMGWPLAEVDKWSASLDDALLLNIYHPVWGEQVLAQRAFTLRYPWYAPGFISLGAAPFLLSLLGFFGARRKDNLRAAMFWMGAIALTLALGVVLRWRNEAVQVRVSPEAERQFIRVLSTLMSRFALHKASLYELPIESGSIPIPLPGLLLYLFVPLGNALRTLYRFGLMTMFAATVFAGMGMANMLGGSHTPEESLARGRYDLTAENQRRRARFGPVMGATLLLALVVVDLVCAPLAFGFSDVRPQPLDRWLAARPADTVVMQFPLTRGLSGDSLYRTRYHNKAVAYGHGTFYPERFRLSMSTLATFPSQESLDLLSAWDVTHVVVGSGAYDVGWGDQAGQTWATVSAQIEASRRLRFVGIVNDEPFWRDERVSKVLYGNPPVVPLLVDKVYVYELQ
jgi:hypothetical protein